MDIILTTGAARCIVQGNLPTPGSAPRDTNIPGSAADKKKPPWNRFRPVWL